MDIVEQVEIRKEVNMARFKVLSRNLPGETEENRKKASGSTDCIPFEHVSIQLLPKCIHRAVAAALTCTVPILYPGQ
jgi:hypothetical protein